MKPSRHSTKSEERRAYWLLVLPAVVIYWAVTAFPLFFSIILSLTNYSGGPIFAFDFKFVGLNNYIRMFKDPYFWISLKNNAYIILVSVFGQIPLGFIFAYAIFRKLVRFGDFFQTMIYLPAVISHRSWHFVADIFLPLWSAYQNSAAFQARMAKHFPSRSQAGYHTGPFCNIVDVYWNLPDYFFS